MDTNVYIDALEDRRSKRGRDLGTPAMSLFSQVQAGKAEIIVSDWVLEELYANTDTEAAKELLSRLKPQIIRCGYTEEQKKEAKAQSNHWQDYLHGMIAEEEDADCIVTRNRKHLKTLSALKVKLPGEVF